jgi:hypothetical protein
VICIVVAANIYRRTLALLTLLGLFLPIVGSQPAGHAALEAKLQKVLQGKVAVLQNFYTSDQLNFDSQGNLKGMSKIGPWTSYGRVEIDSIQLTDHALIIKAKRNVVKWEESASEFSNYTLNHSIHITIDLAPEYDEATLAATIDKVFLNRQQRLSDIVPAYWKELLTTERNRRAKFDQERAQIMQGVLVDASNVISPKLQSSAKGIEISSMPFSHLTKDTLAFSFVVDEKGEVKNLQIEKPVGLGKDDEIATIIKSWKFTPAMQDDKPVSVLMHARRIFFPGRDRDPHQSLPCPDPAQFDC